VSPVPEFTALVDYPAHMSPEAIGEPSRGYEMLCHVWSSLSHAVTVPRRMVAAVTPATETRNTPRRLGIRRTQRLMEKQSGFAIIPTQNKGLCTLCDVNVWVVCQTGLEIKWCKGCKNFRPWAAFGDKGLATKCLRCRERQREKYALQKEEKDKARVPTKHSSTIKSKV
jgi:hypothetical protein